MGSVRGRSAKHLYNVKNCCVRERILCNYIKMTPNPHLRARQGLPGDMTPAGSKSDGRDWGRVFHAREQCVQGPEVESVLDSILCWTRVSHWWHSGRLGPANCLGAAIEWSAASLASGHQMAVVLPHHLGWLKCVQAFICQVCPGCQNQPQLKIIRSKTI